MSRTLDMVNGVSRCHWLDRAGGARTSVVSISDQVVASATTFLTGALIGRMCDEEEFGLYTIGFTLVTLLMAMQSALISTPFMIRIPKLRGEDARRFAASSLVHQAVVAFIAMFLTVIAAAAFTFSNMAMAQLLAAVGAMLLFLLARDYVRQCCFARLAYGRALMLDIMLAVIQLGGLVFLYANGHLSAASAFIVLGIACALTAAHWLIATRSERSYSREAIASDLARTWSCGKWLAASGLLWAVSMNLYPWIVAAMHGASSAGAWAAALGVMTLINPLMLGIQNVLGPRIMHAYASEGTRGLRRVVRDSGVVFFGVLLAFSATMFLFGDALVVFIYGAKYVGNGMLVFFLALNAAVMTIGFVVSRGLFALELAESDFYVNAVAFVCFVVFGIALVRVAGPLGAAIAQLVTNIVVTGVRTVTFTRMSARSAG